MAAPERSQAIPRTPGHNRLRPGATIVGCLLLALVADAQAVEWTFTPRVTARETYSDNIRLAPGGSEESDFVTDISPGFSLRGESRRFFLDLQYNLQYLYYARGTSSDRLLNQLQAVSNAELVEEWLFFDFRGTVSQENITNRGRIADSNISVTGNQTNVYTLSISPYLKHRFGSFMDGELRYRYGFVGRDEVDTGSTSDLVFAELVSGSRFQILPWNIFYRRLFDRPQNRGNALFERVEAGGRYRFTRKHAFIFAGGYERNEFESRPDTENTSGPTWRLGLGLTPTPRTSIDVGVADRFFGLAPFLTATHRSRRTVLAFNYSEEPTTGNQITLDREFIPLLDAFGDPILDPDSGDFITIPVDTPTTVDQVLINRAFSGSIAFRGRRTNATLRLFDVYRDYEVTPDEEVYGVSATASRRLSRAMTFLLGARWSSTRFQDNTNSDFTLWSVSAGLSRQFSRDFSGRIDMRHATQNSDDPRRSYDENRITVQVNKTF